MIKGLALLALGGFVSLRVVADPNRGGYVEPTIGLPPLVTTAIPAIEWTSAPSPCSIPIGDDNERPTVESLPTSNTEPPTVRPSPTPVATLAAAEIPLEPTVNPTPATVVQCPLAVPTVAPQITPPASPAATAGPPTTTQAVIPTLPVINEVPVAPLLSPASVPAIQRPVATQTKQPPALTSTVHVETPPTAKPTPAPTSPPRGDNWSANPKVHYPSETFEDDSASSPLSFSWRFVLGLLLVVYALSISPIPPLLVDIRKKLATVLHTVAVLVLALLVIRWPTFSMSFLHTLKMNIWSMRIAPNDLPPVNILLLPTVATAALSALVTLALLRWVGRERSQEAKVNYSVEHVRH